MSVNIKIFSCLVIFLTAASSVQVEAQAALNAKAVAGAKTSSDSDPIRVAKYFDQQVSEFETLLEKLIDDPNGAFSCIHSVAFPNGDEASQFLSLDYSAPFISEVVQLLKDHLGELNSGDRASFMAWISKLIYGRDEYACLKAPSPAKGIIEDLAKIIFSTEAPTIVGDFKQPVEVAELPYGGPLQAAPKADVPIVITTEETERSVGGQGSEAEHGSPQEASTVRVNDAAGSGRVPMGFEMGGEGCSFQGSGNRFSALPWLLLLFLPVLTLAKKHA